MPVRSMQNVIAALVRRAGLTRADISARRLRHTFALAWLHQHPGRLVELVQLLGHESLDTTAVYTRPRQPSWLLVSNRHRSIRMVDAPDKRTCAAVLPDLGGDQHRMHPEGVQRGRHGAGEAVLGVGLCDIVHGHPVPHASTTDQNVPSAPEPVYSPGCPAGGAPRNRCAAGKSTKTLTPGT